MVDRPPRVTEPGGAPATRQRSPDAQAPCVVNSNGRRVRGDEDGARAARGRPERRQPHGRGARAVVAAPARPHWRRARAAPDKKRTSRYFGPHPDGGAPPRHWACPYVGIPPWQRGRPAPPPRPVDGGAPTSGVTAARRRRTSGVVCPVWARPPPAAAWPRWGCGTPPWPLAATSGAAPASVPPPAIRQREGAGGPPRRTRRWRKRPAGHPPVGRVVGSRAGARGETGAPARRPPRTRSGRGAAAAVGL